MAQAKGNKKRAAENHEVSQQGGDEKRREGKARAEHEGERTRDRPVFLPQVDIYEAPDGLTLVADMPGVTPERLEVTLERRLLTIYGSVSVRPPEDYSILHREYQIGDFERQFTLSGDFDADAIEADLADGVLRIKIPKAPEREAKRIEVRAST